MKIASFFKVLQLIRQEGSEEILRKIELFSYDSLTGLYNRRALDKERVGEYVVVFIDIDNFKKVNDSLGYEKGDEFLKRFAGALKSLSRKEDVFVRWGGDEFILLLPNTKAEGAKSLVERVKKKVEDISLPLTFSFGIIESEGKELSYLLEEASKRMKEVKKGSKRAVL